jgi:hypothetical protein
VYDGFSLQYYRGKIKDKYNLIYSDTDSLVYSLEHEDIYEWIKHNKEQFDLSDSIRDDLKDNTHRKKSL